MATSGTVLQTRVQVNDVIDAAMRRARIPSAAGTPETQEIGRRCAYNYLTSLSNRGQLGFTIEHTVLGTVPAQVYYELPAGTVDVRDVLIRTFGRPTGTPASSAGGTAANAFDSDVSTACTQTSANGNISLYYGSSTLVVSIGVLPATSATWDLVAEVSDDGATWTEVYAFGSLAFVDKVWTYRDIEAPVSAAWFRLRETGGGTLSVREMVFGTSPQEVQMSRLNQDDYVSLPNKTIRGYPIQFFLKRNAFSTQMYIWPTADTWFRAISVWRWRYPEDPGALANEFDVPARWQQALIDNVAWQIALEVGGQNGLGLDWIAYLEKLSLRSTADAEMGDADTAPSYYGGGLASAYTA